MQHASPPSAKPDRAIDIFVNRAAGTARQAGADLPDRIREAFAAAGATARIALVDGADLAAAVHQAAARAPRLVVAGGDGTLSAAAAVLAGTATELAILPLGTLNHLARDAGIPADLAAAAQIAVHGPARPIDTVTVADRTFVNNASIGIYPRLVRARENLQHHGLPKPLAAIPAAWAALTKARDLRLSVDTGNGPERLVTPLLFVGNNRYSLASGSLGQRASLADGKLAVLAVRHRPRLALAWFALRTLFGKANPADDFATLAEPASLHLDADPAHITVALDGETTRLPLPLIFTIRPRSLHLVMPE